MPTDPRTWTDVTDYWTATYANGDLYRYNGMEFVPNGIQFHANRPVYSSIAALAGVSATSGNWIRAFDSPGVTLSGIFADTGGKYGAFADNDNSGNIMMGIAGGGGLPTSPGGLAMVTGVGPMWPASGGGGLVANGLDLYSGITGSTIGGTEQAVLTGVRSAPFFLDIIDGNVQRWALWGYNGSGGTMTPSAPFARDGSGYATRLGAHWVSVYPANGHTVTSAPAPVSSWSSGSTINAATLNGNTGIRDVFRYLNMPPLLRAHKTASQSLSASTNNVITLGGVDYDTYGGWSTGTATYTVPFDGLYLVHGFVTVGALGASTMATGVLINGTAYNGPRMGKSGLGNTSAIKTQIFSLRAGDTIQLYANPGAAVSTVTGVYAPRLIVLNVGSIGTPSPLPTVPNPSYRWTAGTPGDLSTLFNAHIANDLTFLVQRPYLLSYQSSAQSGIAMSTDTAVTMDTVQGIVHSDSSDNYSGWDSTNKRYVAPRDGWYLAVEEVFLAQPSLSTTPWVCAELQVVPGGTYAWDQYQAQFMSGANFPGATAVGYHYLRAGDTIQPGVITVSSSSTTISTAVAATTNSHFECVWLGA